MNTTTLRFCSAAAALGLSALPASASTLGLRTDANYLGFTPNQVNTGSAVWDSFPTYTYTNDAPDLQDTAHGMSAPLLSQTGAKGAQGADLYSYYPVNTVSTNGEVLFGGGSNLSFTITGTVTFSIRGLVLQIKRPNSTSGLLDVAQGFVPTLSINGGAALIADNTNVISGDGDTAVSSTGNYSVTSWFWNASLAGLVEGSTNTFTVTVANNSAQRPLDFLAINVSDQPSAVPEPGTFGLLALGGLALGLQRRRRSLAV